MTRQRALKLGQVAGVLVLLAGAAGAGAGLSAGESFPISTVMLLIGAVLYGACRAAAWVMRND